MAATACKFYCTNKIAWNCYIIDLPTVNQSDIFMLDVYNIILLFFFHIQGSLLAIFMSAGFMQLLSKSSDVKILLLTVNLFRATQEILLENVKKLIKKEIYGNTCFIIIYL